MERTHTFEGGYFSLIKSHCRTGAKLTQVEISRCSPSYKSFTGTMKNLKALGKLNSTMYRMFEITCASKEYPGKFQSLYLRMCNDRLQI